MGSPQYSFETKDPGLSRGLVGKHYYSGFDLAHDTYNALTAASDGKVYYLLSSVSIDKGGQMFAYDPDTDKVRFVADVTEVCGEKGGKAIPQGKSHVNFYERDGKLYFATHVGVYEIIDGMERLPENIPAGYRPYPGGHFISYDLRTGDFQDLAIAPDGEGILTMTMDEERGDMYAITWPKGNFLHYDLRMNSLKNLGRISSMGEAGVPGDDYRVLCRSMVIDPQDGTVYFSTAEGDIFFYRRGAGSIEKFQEVNLRLDYFGQYDTRRPGTMGYNWRKIFWYAPEGVAYGVHGNSGYLFRFDPRGRNIELVERITSGPSRKSGMFDQFSYGYLGMQLDQATNTIYYLTGGPVYLNGQRVKGEVHIARGGAKGLENLHLVTYEIPKGRYIDHGPIFYEDGSRPTYVNSIAIGRDGNVYALARYEHNGKTLQDLMKIPNPFAQGRSAGIAAEGLHQ